MIPRSICRPRLVLGLSLLLGMAAAGSPIAAPEPVSSPGPIPLPAGRTVRVTGGPVRAVPPYVTADSVADSTWVLRAGTANVLAALTPAGWVLVDTGTRAEAMPIRSEVQRLAARPIVAVFNTHFHDDHAGGNAVYRGMGVPIYASRATQRLEEEIRSRTMKGAPREVARLDSCAATAPAGPDQDRAIAFYEFLARWWREGALEAARDPLFVVPADRPFDDRLRIVIGGLVIEARAFARGAHSAGDAIVVLPSRRVAAIGDIAIKGGAPWADQFMGEGSLEGIMAAQDTLTQWLAAADTTWRLVPGHGSTLRPSEFQADREALRQLRACARLSFDAGQPRPVAAGDCADVGFPGSTAAYAVWLFAEEWRAAAPRSPGGRPLTKP